MQTLIHMDPELYARARKKQADLVDRVVGALSGEWERGWSRRWVVEPHITFEDVMEDLRHGRD